MINIVIPMAGLGSRFAGGGEELPKPLIEVVPGRPMIGYVIDFLSLREPHRLIFVCRAEHDRRFRLGALLRRLAPGSEIILTEALTRGPAATALLAQPLIDNSDELVVAYCDSFLGVDFARFIAEARRSGADGAVITFPSSSPADSYAVVDPDGRVRRTAEKQVISPHATDGFYYFRTGRDYVAATGAMIDSAPIEGPELFVCPVYNHLIEAGATVISYPISRADRFDMGTPADLDAVRRQLAPSAQVAVAAAR